MANFKYHNFTRAVAMCLSLLFPLTATAQSVTSLNLAPSLIFGGDTSVGTVRLNKNASGSGFTVNLASSQSLAKVPATVVVPAGQQTVTFNITTVPVATNTSASISAAGGGSSASYTLTIKVPVPKTVTFAPSRIAGGTSGTGTVTLTQVAAVATVCNLKSDSSLALVPASVTIPAGSNSVNFAVTTKRTADIVNANISASRGSVVVTGILPVLPIGLDLSSPWAKFHGDTANTGYSPNGVTSPDWSATIGSPVLSSPAIGLDGTIYVGANNGYLYALKGTDGSMLWKYKTGGRVASSPVVTKNGVVFVGSADKSVYAINGTNGAKLWSYKTGGAVISTPCIGADGSLYVGSYDGCLYALDQSSGSKLWSFQTGGPVVSSPNISGIGILYVGSNDNCLYAIDTLSRTKLWSYTTGGDVQSSPALANGNVYFGSFDGNVYALNQTTGAKVWNVQTDWVVYSSPCVDSAGNVFVGSDDANIYSLNGSTGALNWSYLTDDCVGSSPALDLTGNLCVGSDDGNLYCLNAAGGSLIQAAPQTGAVESSPAITAGAAVLGTTSLTGQVKKNKIVLTIVNFDVVWFNNGVLQALNIQSGKVSDLFNTGIAGADMCTCSPDGSKIAFMSSGAAQDVSIYLVKRDGSELQRLSGTETGWNGWMHWSPDSKRLAYTHYDNYGYSGKLLEFNSLTGASIVLKEAPSQISGTFAADYLSNSSLIYVVPRSTTGNVVMDIRVFNLTNGQDSVLKPGLISVGPPVANPSTGLVAFPSQDNGSGQNVGWNVVTMDTRSVQYRVTGAYSYAGWAMAPDDKLVFNKYNVLVYRDFKNNSDTTLLSINRGSFGLLRR